MNNTSSIEETDAKKVNEALEALAGGNVTLAQQLLEAVVVNTPTTYQFQVSEGDSLVMKFWTMTDLIHFVTIHRESIKQQIVWRASAYPRAYYYLGFLAVRQGQFARAMDMLDAGYRLEPNPMFLCEKAQVFVRGFRDYDQALSMFDRVLERGNEVPGNIRALAFRGRGFVLIELGKLDLAEESFVESLSLEPGNEIARNELMYIENLRHGGDKVPSEIVERSKTSSLVCAFCGKDFTGGSVSNVAGRLTYICEKCQIPPVEEQPPKPQRKWWQFWK
jgi:tetratricopeptide (TPR) repeat protein